MGRVAGRLELLDLVWSKELLAEARRSLIEKKRLTTAATYARLFKSTASR
jgi:hypothetical protein